MQHRKIKQAIADIRAGKLVIVADDENRENEGDLVGAAEQVTPEMINFMATHARGLICLTLLPERCQALGLTQMAEHNTEAHETAFTVSIDAAARFGVTTGISAADRAATIRVAVDPASVPTDLRRPGHVFPLRARPGGVLQRVGQTEASMDLARLAGLYPAGVICEILNPDGSMARQQDLEQFAARHELSFITVAELVAYRLAHERLVHAVAQARLPTPFVSWIRFIISGTRRRTGSPCTPCLSARAFCKRFCREASCATGWQNVSPPGPGGGPRYSILCAARWPTKVRRILCRTPGRRPATPWPRALPRSLEHPKSSC